MHTRNFQLRGPLAASLLALMVASPALAQTTDQDTGTGQTDATQPDTAQTGALTTDDVTGADDTQTDTAQTGALTTDDVTGADDTQTDTAQTGTTTGEDTATQAQSDAQVGGQPIDQAIEEADAPTTAATDTRPGALGAQDAGAATGETTQAQTGDQAGQPPMDQQQATVGTQPAPSAEEMPQAAQQLDSMTEPGPGPAPTAQDQMAGGQQGQGMMIDVERFAQDLYERGYRQGYIRGATEARLQIVAELQRARQAQDMQGMQGQSMQGQQQAQQRPMPGQMQGGAMGGQQPQSGAVIVLPPGVSPEAFIEGLQQRRGD